MEKFYLEIPSIERKEEALEYLKEFVEYKSEINGTGGLNRCLDGMSYEEWLEETFKCMDKEYADKKGLVSATPYFTVRESDNKIVGMICLRHYLNDTLRKVGGHIGYSIRPTERRKGYSKIQLYLVLLEAKKMKLDKVMLDCHTTNLGSKKTIEALGGIFEEEVSDERDGRKLYNYWINVDESIEKYKEKYEKYILKSKRKC